MSRTVQVSIAGVVYAMPVNTSASMLVDEQAGDPLKMAKQMVGGEMLSSRQTLKTIAAGVRSAGCDLESEQITDAIIDAGVQNYLPIATTYVIALVSGSPEKPIPKAKKKTS